MKWHRILHGLIGLAATISLLLVLVTWVDGPRWFVIISLSIVVIVGGFALGWQFRPGEED